MSKSRVIGAGVCVIFFRDTPYVEALGTKVFGKVPFVTLLLAISENIGDIPKVSNSVFKVTRIIE